MKPIQKDLLDEFQPSRRDFIRKTAKAGFVVPVVASFTMSGLLARPAAAQPNSSIPFN